MDTYSLHNGFELPRVFGSKVPLASKADMQGMIGWQASAPIRRIVSRFGMRSIAHSRWCIEPHFHFWPGISTIGDAVYLHGYWQSEKYFADVGSIIRKDFTFDMPWDDADLAVRGRMRAQPSASLHIRRGDYTQGRNQRVYAPCTVDYYHDAIKVLASRVPDIKFFAFSDDPDWVAERFSAEFEPLEIVRHNTGLRGANDMRLMALADHHVIANSSFSWWSAWLNPSPAKIVIAPKQWFLNGTNDCDLIPASWIRL